MVFGGCGATSTENVLGKRLTLRSERDVGSNRRRHGQGQAGPFPFCPRDEGAAQGVICVLGRVTWQRGMEWEGWGTGRALAFAQFLFDVFPSSLGMAGRRKERQDQYLPQEDSAESGPCWGVTGAAQKHCFLTAHSGRPSLPHPLHHRSRAEEAEGRV